MRRLLCLPAFFLLLMSITAGDPLAQTVPGTINFQGRLTDNSPSQTPIDGPVPMKFSIWDAQPAGTGTKLWEEPASGAVSVTVIKGIFSIPLGSVVPIPSTVFSGATSNRFLEITIDPEGVPETITPRQLISSTAYAQRSEKTATADTVTNGVYTTGTYDDPTWLNTLAGSKIAGSVSSAATAATADSATNFSGALAGDVTGTQGATTVAAIRGTAVSPTAPAPNQVLQYTGGQWQPASPSMVETDPKVGALTTGRVPRWGGTTLADGAIFDDGAGKVGLGTTAPKSTIDIQGSLAVKTAAVTADTTLGEIDNNLSASGNLIVTLPSASASTVGRIYAVRNEGSGLVQVRAAGADLLNGTAGGVFLLGGGQAVRVTGTGSSAWIANR